MQAISEIVGLTLKEMRAYARPGMNTRELDAFGGHLLQSMGARSAPQLTYGFPGHTCISVNQEIAHGIPSPHRILQEGDLVNIDVSAEKNGFYADNGGSFVLGADLQHLQPLVDTSRRILHQAIRSIRGGVKISDIGHLIEQGARKAGFRVIRNLAGHGVGRSLHEDPSNILNYRDKGDRKRFRTHSVIAVETFIATHSNAAVMLDDGWTLVGNRGGFVAQHEHTLVVTSGEPLILTAANEI